MKQLTLAALAIIGLAFVPVYQVGASEQFINEADTTVIESADKSLTKLGESEQNESATWETIKPLASDASAKLEAVTKHTYTTELGEDYTSAATDLKTKAAQLKTSIDDLIVAVDGGVETEIQAKGTAYDSAHGAFYSSYDALNAAIAKKNTELQSQDSMTASAYLATLIATGVITVATFAWAYMKKDTNKELAEAQRSVALSSLWPLGGAAITYGSYALASNGDSYTIAWGAVVAGLFFYGKAVFDYVMLRKKPATIPAKA